VTATSHRGRRRGSTVLLTGSPYKSTLTESSEKWKELPAKTKLILSQANQSKCGKSTSTKKLVKRSKHDSTSDNSSDDDEPPYVSIDDSDSDNGDDAQCPFCHGLFSSDNKGETWIQCTNVFNGRTKSVTRERKKHLITSVCLALIDKQGFLPNLTIL
jgi:hypothetical protein